MLGLRGRCDVPGASRSCLQYSASTPSVFTVDHTYLPKHIINYFPFENCISKRMSWHRNSLQAHVLTGRNDAANAAVQQDPRLP